MHQETVDLWSIFQDIKSISDSVGGRNSHRNGTEMSTDQQLKVFFSPVNRVEIVLSYTDTQIWFRDSLQVSLPRDKPVGIYMGRGGGDDDDDDG